MSDSQAVCQGLIATTRRWWRKSVERTGFISTLSHFHAALWNFLRNSTPSRRRQRYGDVDYDWDHRVDTTGATVGWHERWLGELYSPYQPTEANLFQEMLNSLDIDFSDFTFIDLGSGKGRTLLLASEYPFGRILGVELLPALHAIAEHNILNYKSDSQFCRKIESICADACEFVFPLEPIVLYLFNPLPISGLRKALDHLEQSLRVKPRPIHILYHNPEHEQMLAERAFLRKTGGTHQYSQYAYNELDKAPIS
jgi:hypothetical protein